MGAPVTLVDPDGRYVDASGGGGSGPSEVEVTNFPPTQAVSGPLTNAQLTAVTGTAAQTAVTTDPTASGQTVVALLRGILSELQAINANTTPDP